MMKCYYIITYKQSTHRAEFNSFAFLPLLPDLNILKLGPERVLFFETNAL